MSSKLITLLAAATALLCACQADLVTMPISPRAHQDMSQHPEEMSRPDLSPASDMRAPHDLSQTRDAEQDHAPSRDMKGSSPDLDPSPKLTLKTLKAFPTADGYGAGATGGRGGKLLYVTTTQDTNSEGSLRWALTRDYPRVIYFLVGGEFKIESLLYVDNGDLTIAGETAHDLGGVNIRGCDATRDCRLYFSEPSNMIIRFISVESGWRNWQKDGTQESAMVIVGGHNIILDHYTGGWGCYTGGVTSKVNSKVGRSGLMTTQRSLLHEGVSGHNVGGVGGIQMDWVRNHPRAEHERIWAAWDGFSNHRNAFIGLTHRFYNTSGNGLIADQMYNNYIYGWSSRMSRHTNGNQPIDIYRNYYEAAPYNADLSYSLMHKFDYNTYYNLDPPIPTAPNFFIAENLIVDKDGSIFQNVNDDNWPMITHFIDTPQGQAGTSVTRSSQRTQRSADPLYPVKIIPVDQVKDDVLNNAGAGVRFNPDGSTYNADPIEVRYLDWAKNKTGPSFSSRTIGDGGLGDSARFRFPEYTSTTRDPATLNPDGTPIGWQPPADVINEAGYSNLELYLAQLAGDLHMLRRDASR